MSVLSVLPEFKHAVDINDSQYDGIILITSSPANLSTEFTQLQTAIANHIAIDTSNEIAIIRVDGVPGNRIVLVPTGTITRDYDDVRTFAESAEKGIKKALSAGLKSPLLLIDTNELGRYPLAKRVSYLGALYALYNPIECREAKPADSKKVDKLGFFVTPNEINILHAIEAGRTLCRDIGGSDPERMAAPRVAKYVEEIFKDTCIKVNIISDLKVIEKEYPLMEAVNRAARKHERHAARVIFLEYQGDGNIDTTLLFVGKGITYDTGGADVKAGGHMAGMHRDKCGAAFVAGFFQMLALCKPKGIKVIGGMAMVRNSIGSDAYVADEIVTSRAGVRVRIGNTDAEGRMVLSDVLCEMKERSINEVNPHIFSVATLTGHVARAYGVYSAILDNGPAKSRGIGKKIKEAGEISGDPFEISSLRREDYEFHKGKSEYEDVLQCNNLPSTMTNRGHQTPAAFLNMASGLDKHGNDSKRPLPYSHIDIAGSSGPFPGVPTAAPLVALSHAFITGRLA